MLNAHERFVASGPLRIWTERIGDPGLPAVLMVMGSAAQSVSCPDALVSRLVERGVQVIRFDHRDTGRSSVVDFDAHPYTIGDMARDCLAVLDGYGLGSAHVAGTSLGGMLALELASAGQARLVTALAPAGFWATARARNWALRTLAMIRATGKMSDRTRTAVMSRKPFRLAGGSLLFGHPSRVPVEAMLEDLAA
ncbi:alpha/beta fold hydrolase, partial [Kibdelosporangium lantanae]